MALQAQLAVLLLTLVYFSSAAPVFSFKMFKRQSDSSSSSNDPTVKTSSDVLLTQLQNPSGVLAVLLIIGGDIVQKAIAQSRRRTLIPVAFSFGWVGYAFTSLMSVWGEGVLMPVTDCDAEIINLSSGTKKKNESWVLGRVIRDLGILHARQKKAAGLGSSPAVYFYRVKPGAGGSKPGKVWLALPFIPIQFVIASLPIWIPHLRHHPSQSSWIVMMILGGGTLLALLTSLLPQWHAERFDARPTTKDNYILTKGNGHLFSFVVLNTNGEVALNLEDLAVIRPELMRSDLTKWCVPPLMLCWVFLLLLVAGLERDSWYLLGVGGAGMVQNVIIASSWKRPENHGLPMELIEDDGVVEDSSMMKVLMIAELKRPGTGVRLLKVFFGDAIRAWEEPFWQYQKENWKARDDSRKAGGNVELLDPDQERTADAELNQLYQDVLNRTVRPKQTSAAAASPATVPASFAPVPAANTPAATATGSSVPTQGRLPVSAPLQAARASTASATTASAPVQAASVSAGSSPTQTSSAVSHHQSTNIIHQDTTGAESSSERGD